MALRVSRTARRRYGLGELLAAGGRSPPPALPTLRQVADRINRARALDEAAERLSGATLLATSAIEDRLVEALPGLDGGFWQSVLDRLVQGAGVRRVEGLLARWAVEFGSSGEEAPLALQLRELVTLWLLEENAAVGAAVALLSEGAPRAGELWRAVDPVVSRRWARSLRRLSLSVLPAPGGLSEQLRALAASGESESPSLSGTEGRERAAARDALTAADALAEERRPEFAPPADAAPAVDLAIPSDWEPEWSPTARYSPEAPWMAGIVLVAKQVHVWLDQLSRRSGRSVRRLDDVPVEELERLASWGFNAIWLVGIWERSRASRWIKQLGGNPEAAASAYAVAQYGVADELGGEAALAVLRERAAACGLRLAADMVPNHMGIDSTWVVEHPERFLSLPEPPFPSYSFRGPDLSPDPRVSLYLEDHYYDRSDAAVVFQRVDRRSGETRYLYHGNDGTGLPWNDTAQLDYLRADVREAVLETIVRMARLFPILRFDAAMTLARRHYQRLWFPLPGGGGAIPSRAGHGVSPDEFELRFPVEFWSQVVERVTRDEPETLLVAEAFWLMEAYFARELGLHRVYNSAFANHLRTGRPAALRRHLAEILLRDPRLLAHQVNYLSNPDEVPARELYGIGERYLGACTLLATLPGLPLFAHGQVEGLRERYGMEYRRSYVDEEPDPDVVAAHQRRVAPLLARRGIFSDAERFRLYELAAGECTDQVLAFSNGRGSELHLVASNQGPRAAGGVIDRSAPVRVGGAGAATTSRLRDLLPAGGEGALALSARDLATGRGMSWPASSLPGLALELAPWQTAVWTDFAWVQPPAAGPARVPDRPWWLRLLAWLSRCWRRLRGR